MASSQAPALTYTLHSDPSPLQVSPLVGDPSLGKLLLTVQNNSKQPVAVQQLVISLPLGDEAGQLTSEGPAIKASDSPSAEWELAITSTDGTLVATATPRYPNVDGCAVVEAGNSLAFTLKGIPINQQPGDVAVTIQEYAKANGQEALGETTLQVKKTAYQFYFRNLSADRPRVKHGDSVTLTWEGSAHATYTLLYDDKQEDVTFTRSWPKEDTPKDDTLKDDNFKDDITKEDAPAAGKKLYHDTTFILRAQVDVDGQLETHELSVTVMVDKPDLVATSLQVTGNVGTGNVGISDQGAYLQWNRSLREGETWLLNQKGYGNDNAGIRFGSVTTGNAVTEWARFIDNGNLGIGTTSPGHPLTIKADASGNAALLGFSTNAGTDKYNFSLKGGGLNLSESNVAGGRLFVQDGTGNVGIGTTSPATKLDVNGHIGNSHNVGTNQHDPNNRGNWRIGRFNATEFAGIETEIKAGNNCGNASVLKFYTWGCNISGNREVMRITEWGSVGIGTSSPIALLHVNGNVDNNYYPFSYTSAKGNSSKYPNKDGASYFSLGSGETLVHDNAATKSRQVAMYVEGGEFWVDNAIFSGGLKTTSDYRIKRVIGVSDRAVDLALLNQIRVTDYTYIDQVAHSPQVMKKVIAQEVQQVLPAAVTARSAPIPNVYERASHVNWADGQLIVTTDKPHELPPEGGKMLLYTPQNESLHQDVTVVDAHTFRLASTTAHTELFVYGKYVDDFLSVDYDAIAMLNVSATQELVRKVDILEDRNAQLEAKCQAQEARLDQQQALLLALQEQMALLLGGAVPAASARPVIEQA